jgi:Tfp pilus assembly protein PilO
MDTSFNKNFIIGLSVIFGSVLVVGVALFFLSGMVAGSVTAILADKSKINGQSNSVADIAELRQEAVQAASYQAAMNKLLPMQDALINFNAWVSSVAAADHVAATASFQGQPSPPLAGSAGQAEFSIAATGSVQDIANFLNDIELRSLGFLVQLTSIDLVDQGSNYELTAQGQAFFQ